EVKDKAETTY
ncbi:unnamed protein product, partial [Allacma fusca]